MRIQLYGVVVVKAPDSYPRGSGSNPELDRLFVTWDGTDY